MNHLRVGSVLVPLRRIPRFLSFQQRTPADLTLSLWVCVGAAVMIAVAPLVLSAALEQDFTQASSPPSLSHVFGTDRLGRDVWLLALAGSPAALIGPVIIALGATLIGTVCGVISGTRGAHIDAVMSRIADLTFALPLVLVALVFAGIFDTQYWTTVLLLAVFMSPGDFRIIRAATQEQLRLPYLEAAQLSGIPRARLLWVHLLPNVLPYAVVNMMLNLPGALFSIAALSYLGVGSGAGIDWGAQLTTGQSIMFLNPAAVCVPALLIIVISMSANTIADHLVTRLNQGDFRAAR